MYKYVLVANFVCLLTAFDKIISFGVLTTTWLHVRMLIAYSNFVHIQVKGVEQEFDGEDEDAALTGQIE